MALGESAVEDRVSAFDQDLDRALQLYDRIAESGFTQGEGGTPSPLRHTDRRDAAQFIFFEAAAKFEAFTHNLFLIEVRKRIVDSPKRAQFIMGHADRGLAGVMGWGSPKTVRDRARNLFGKSGFFACFDSVVGLPTYQNLQLAHTLRNRVAHDTGDARTKYRKALNQLRIPKKARRGAGVGRILLDYPSTASRTDRWFHRFLAAYRRVGARANARL